MSQHSSRGKEWDAIRQAVLDRDNYICGYGCGREATQVDHIIPKASGGTDDESNLIAACPKCNNIKGAKVLIRNNYVNKKWMEQL